MSGNTLLSLTSTGQQFAIPGRIAVRYLKGLKIKKILSHPYNGYLFIRHLDKIVQQKHFIPIHPTSEFRSLNENFNQRYLSLCPKLPINSSLEGTVVETINYKIPQYSGIYIQYTFNISTALLKILQ